jgi:small subunit ribosomal protein S2
LIELEKLVESGEIETYSKKMTSQLMREKAKITRNLDGIRNMSKLPGAMVVIDANTEVNALREATALRIPTIGLIDSDGNPDLVDIPIPGNDDSLRSIEVVIAELMSAVSDGLAGRRAKEVEAQRVAENKAKEEAQAAADHEEAKAKSSRASFKADDSSPEPKDKQGAATVATAQTPKTETDNK